MSEYTQPTFAPVQCCHHDVLARKCETCAAEHELAWTQQQLAALTAEVDRLRASKARLVAECVELRELLITNSAPNPNDRPHMARIRAVRFAVDHHGDLKDTP